MLSFIFLPLIFLLGACGVGGLLLAVLYPRITAGAALDRRLRLISVTRTVEMTLREGDQRQKLRAKSRANPTLLVRMRQGDMSWSRKTYYLVCVATGIVAFLLIMGATELGALPAVGFGIAAGLLLPHFYVKIKRARRFKRFSAEFPNALDVIVRGIKAGLPLIDCLKIIATETQDPVKREFRILVEDQTLGIPMADAVQRLPDRMPLTEASFFAIVLAIQSRSGGSMSEALANLSKVLRERKKIREKIKAMSGEAKASALIIGILPVIVIGLLYVTSPNYIALLFTTQTGHIVLAVCGLLMASGTLVMRKMINFDV
jgi:tight adherence protein B